MPAERRSRMKAATISALVIAPAWLPAVDSSDAPVAPLDGCFRLQTVRGARDRIGKRLSEYPARAGIRVGRVLPRKRASERRLVVSGGVGVPVAVEIEQIVRRGH